MARFLEALHSGRVLLMDGAMGTELQKAGLPDGESGESWSLTHPERVMAVHRAYAEAGAEVLLTNTFQAHRLADPHATFERAHEIARSVAGPGRFILNDVGPDADALFAAGEFPSADGMLLETFSGDEVWDLTHMLRKRSAPLLLSPTYLRDKNGRVRTSCLYSPESFASQAAQHGVTALGVNCGRDIGMDEIIEIVRCYRSETDLPLFARPNAGTPRREDGRWVYPLTPAAMAARLPELLAAGVSMVGGCCGTTPAHIAACKPIIDAWNARWARSL